MPDPRLYPAISRHTRSKDPRRRAVAAGAIAPDAHGAFLLGELIDDLDADVRSAAVAATAAFGGEVLAARIGDLLSDQSWKVRLQAGQTLAALGPVGALTLRHHLFDSDPYARDMARRALDDIAARERRQVLPAPVPPGIDPWTEEGQVA
jgi:HEAT repeat protein